MTFRSIVLTLCDVTFVRLMCILVQLTAVSILLGRIVHSRRGVRILLA